MNKTEIESKVEGVIKRLCAGVIVHNEYLELLKTERDPEGHDVGGFSGASMTKYVLRCHDADMPRLVGKGGDRFRAIRSIIALAGLHFGRELQLAYVVPPVHGIGAREPFPRFKPNPHWPKAEITALLEDTAGLIFTSKPRVSLKEMESSAVFTVKVGAEVTDDVIEAVTSILNAIFNGIGVTHGIQLSIDVARRSL